MSWRLQGFRPWLIQRLTAVYVGLYLIFFLFALAMNAPADVEAWRAWMLGGPMAMATSVFFIALLMHAWVGVRDVVIDYVHPVAVRFSLLVVIAVGLLIMGLWVLRIFLATNA